MNERIKQSKAKNASEAANLQDDQTLLSSTMTSRPTKTIKPQMVSVCDLFYFADTVNIKICIIASCCFALVTGAVYPGKEKGTTFSPAIGSSFIGKSHMLSLSWLSLVC
jgi:hypothetical protein